MISGFPCAETLTETAAKQRSVLIVIIFGAIITAIIIAINVSNSSALSDCPLLYPFLLYISTTPGVDHRYVHS